MSGTSPLLFQPITVGRLSLKHRVVHAPLTRFRNFKYTHIPYTDLMKEYHIQRASTPGTLIIAEATLISLKAAGDANSPGIWTDKQIAAWKEDCYIYLQLAAIGRVAPLSGLEADNITLVGPSPIPLSTQPLPIPRELTKDDIKYYVQMFATAPKNAVFGAGFDGVEIHGANGYLIDQFLQDISNQKNDEYGGRNVVGEDRSALSVSPWSTDHELGMPDPYPQFIHVIRELKAAHPNLAYLYAVEPRLAIENGAKLGSVSNDFIREIWTRQTAIQNAQDKGDLIAFGRLFLANPDFPLNKYHRPTFYVPAEDLEAHIGYTDYPFYIDEGNANSD
ncbi:hypothetical protein BDQ17DRAFT_1429769 [Cyathus striatus]|nr:hypothetical protein BDQ17DRAFT_1429769 [Cyathus striatus]